MKIKLGDKYYTRDHPRELKGYGLLGFDEIRQWWRTFLTDPAYGPWSYTGLARAMGTEAASIKNRLTQTWIWPNEQKKFTHRIHAIREGYLVMRIIDGKHQAVYIDPPEPPKVKEVRVLQLRATVKGLEFGPKPPVFGVPKFSRAFLEVPISASKKWRRSV